MTRSRWWSGGRAVQLVAALTAGLALVACGMPDRTPGTAATPTQVAAESGPATDGASEPRPASIPAAPPPQRFVDRAAVVARAVRAAGLPRASAGPPGLPEPGPGFTGVEAPTRVEGNTLTVNLTHGACDPELQGHVVEFEDLVVVGGTHGPLPPDVVCAAVLISSPSTLTLARPLGDRPVVSAVTGAPLRVNPPLG